MKQIIVNVSSLTIEEKQRVNEALAKITGVRKIPLINSSAGWFFAPASSCVDIVSWELSSSPETPTHTPQQVLEMAGMAENRKVRKDFDPTKEYSVDVSNCTEDEKKEVQQAFFDVGIKWARSLAEGEYHFLDMLQYSNARDDGVIVRSLLMSNSTEGCNMTPTEFLELVYEPEQQGHVHAELMAQYAEDAKTTDKPWKNFQWSTRDGKWLTMQKDMQFESKYVFRRKPKTHIVNGVEVPDLRFVPKNGDRYYLADPTEREFTFNYAASSDSCDTVWAERGLCYEYTEKGKQAAILHAKAWLGIA